jgi:hypothetical protein
LAERHLLLVKVLPPPGGEGGDAEVRGERKASVLNTVSLGRLVEVERWLTQFNCARDGKEGFGGAMNVLYGPGVVMQLPMVDRDDPVMQLMVSLNDETIAWAVLERLCRVSGWKMMDPKTGSIFGG